MVFVGCGVIADGYGQLPHIIHASNRLLAPMGLRSAGNRSAAPNGMVKRRKTADTMVPASARPCPAYRAVAFLDTAHRHDAEDQTHESREAA